MLEEDMTVKEKNLLENLTVSFLIVQKRDENFNLEKCFISFWF
jgi:hypothetical protein